MPRKPYAKSRPATPAWQLKRAEDDEEIDLHDHAHTYNHWRERHDEPCFVYLLTEWDTIAEERTAYAKIGMAKDPVVRLRTHRTSNPRHLQLAGLILGGRNIERMMHQRFAHFQFHPVSYEWFHCPNGGIDLMRLVFFEIDRAQLSAPGGSTQRDLDRIAQEIAQVRYSVRTMGDDATTTGPAIGDAPDEDQTVGSTDAEPKAAACPPPVEIVPDTIACTGDYLCMCEDCAKERKRLVLSGMRPRPRLPTRRAS